MTGVQTCALPISALSSTALSSTARSVTSASRSVSVETITTDIDRHLNVGSHRRTRYGVLDGGPAPLAAQRYLAHRARLVRPALAERNAGKWVFADGQLRGLRCDRPLLDWKASA